MPASVMACTWHRMCFSFHFFFRQWRVWGPATKPMKYRPPPPFDPSSSPPPPPCVHDRQLRSFCHSFRSLHFTFRSAFRTQSRCTREDVDCVGRLCVFFLFLLLCFFGLFVCFSSGEAKKAEPTIFTHYSKVVHGHETPPCPPKCTVLVVSDFFIVFVALIFVCLFFFLPGKAKKAEPTIFTHYSKVVHGHETPPCPPKCTVLVVSVFFLFLLLCFFGLFVCFSSGEAKKAEPTIFTHYSKVVHGHETPPCPPKCTVLVVSDFFIVFVALIFVCLFFFLPGKAKKAEPTIFTHYSKVVHGHETPPCPPKCTQIDAHPDHFASR